MAGLAIALQENKAWLAIPALIPLILYTLRIKNASNTVLAVGIFYASLSVPGFILFTPLAFTSPFVWKSRKPSISKLEASRLAPSTWKLLKYAAGFSVIALVSIGVLAAVAILILAALTYSVIYYLKLSNISVKIGRKPRKIPLGEGGNLILNVNSKQEVYILVIRDDGRKEASLISGPATIAAPLPADHAGVHSSTFTVIIMDKWGFAKRVAGHYYVNYFVMPLTSATLKTFREGIFSRKDIIRFIGEVEIALSSLESEPSPFKAEIRGARRAKEALQEEIAQGIKAPALKLAIKFLKSVEAQMKLQTSLQRSPRRSRIGEYIGARDYAPGDAFKNIHWKKTISRGSIVIKEYSSSDAIPRPSRASKLQPIIIADLFAVSHIELDRILFTLLGVLAAALKKSPSTELALIIVVGKKALSVKGRSIDILYHFYKALEKSMPKIIYPYKASIKPADLRQIDHMIKSKKKPKPHSVILAANKKFASKLVQILIQNNLTPPKPYTVVYSGALSFRYNLLRRELEEIGYTFIQPKTLITRQLPGKTVERVETQ